MKTAAWIRGLAVTALLASACGSASTPATGTAPSPSASPSTAASTPSATPTPASNPCPPPSNRCLALVTLRGSNSIVVRDITDIGHAKTISNLGLDLRPQFVSATALSYVDAKRGLLLTPLSGSPRTPIAGGGEFFTWSPDGKTAAYMSSRANSGGRTTMQLHLVSRGKDGIVSSMPGLPSGFGCESQACADGWDFHLSYSPDGRSITWAQSVTDVFRMWTAAGIDVTPSTPFVNMSVWSGANFYFEDSKEVKVWRNGVVSTFLPGVVWIRPKASPGGGQIVYETRDASGVSRTYVVDTTTAKVRQLGGAYRAEPVFLSARFIWYQGERSCTLNECFPGSAIATGKTYIYDLKTGTETESVITQVFDVWPHAG
jgi:WD40-like Beta Propeller Repeat